MLLMVSFAMQKLLSLYRSCLDCAFFFVCFFFLLYFFCLRRQIKKKIYIYMLLQFMSKSVLLLFSYMIFMVSDLTFRFLIHFEFIFVYDVSRCPNLIVLHVTVQFSQHHSLKRLSFLRCIFLPPLS